MKHLSATLLICVVLGLLSLSSAALAFYNPVEPPLPGSVEYGLTSQGLTWIRTDAPITVGIYVEDILDHRFDQPLGRGAIGLVTATGIGDNYEWCALVDFGRSYSVGLDFHELSAITLDPEPPSLLVLLAGIGPIAVCLRRPPFIN